MQRRDVLRRGTVVGVAALTTGLAGCSGDSTTSDDGSSNDNRDESGDNNDGGSDDGGDSTPTGPTGEVVENSVSGLEIVDWTTTTTKEDLRVALTVENVGDQETEAFNYTYEATAYNSAGEDITAGVATGSTGSTVAPGETTAINLYLGAFGGPAEIARFELTLRCGTFDDAVYCEN